MIKQNQKTNIKVINKGFVKKCEVIAEISQKKEKIKKRKHGLNLYKYISVKNN